MKEMKMTVRQMFLIVDDIISVIIVLFGSLILRFNGEIEYQYLSHVNKMMMFVIAASIIIFGINKLYHILWQFASINELKNILHVIDQYIKAWDHERTALAQQ